ncbi:MAG TPA: hypothetical protein VMW94_05905, partial [Actinomycetes bacterium]|nr:hypothetical protein [Actinomycetes bacterium]
PVEVLLALGGVPGSWSTDDRVAALVAGATQYQLRGLDGPSTQHTAAVRHRDPFGGTSAVVTHTFSTGTTAPTAPRPAGLVAAEVSGQPVDVS